MGTLWTDGYFDPSPNPPGSPQVARCPRCTRLFWLAQAKRRDKVNGPKPPSHEGGPPDIQLPAPQDLREAVAAGLARDRTEEIRLRSLIFQADNHALRRPREAFGLAALTALVGALLLVLAIYRIAFGANAGLIALLFALASLVLLASGARDVASSARTRSRRARAQQERQSGTGPFFTNLRELFDLLGERDPEERLLKAEAARELSEFDKSIALLAGPWPTPLLAHEGRIRALAEARNAAVATVPEPSEIEPERAAP